MKARDLAKELKNYLLNEEEGFFITTKPVKTKKTVAKAKTAAQKIVSKTASETLINKTGVCWTKSCLLAAILRANQIPSGISYQLLTRSDDESEGYMIHALNTVYINDLKKWIRLDARGNKENINASFNLDEEQCTGFKEGVLYRWNKMTCRYEQYNPETEQFEPIHKEENNL